MKRIFSILVLMLALCSVKLYAQPKMIVGDRHSIFVNMPTDWLQAQHEALPFFIKPNAPNVSDMTYLYVYGIDYSSSPELDKWIEGNNAYVVDNFEGVILGELDIKLDNIVPDDFLTGKYKTITYTYTNGRMEALVIIELNHTIATIVLSTNGKAEFEKYLPSLIEVAKSFRALDVLVKRG